MARIVDALVEGDEALGSIAEAVEPRVPRLDVWQRRREQPRAVTADHQRRAPRRRREEQCVVDLVVPAADVTRSPASRRRTISNASSKRETRWSNGRPNARNSSSFHPAPTAIRSRPRTQFVDRGRRAREQARFAKGGAGDQRPELDALGDRRQPREQRPAVPRRALGPDVAAVEQVVADPDRVEAGLLRRAGELGVFRPAHLALHFGQLDADLHAQNSAKASGSVGSAVTSVQMPLVA